MLHRCPLVAALLLMPLSLQPREGLPNAKIEALVEKMTLDEKLSLVHGIPDPNNFGEAATGPVFPDWEFHHFGLLTAPRE